MATATAESLAKRLAEDIDSTFPALVLEYQDGLYSGIRSYVGATDAEDVTQETFIRAHRALHAYDAGRVAELALRPWLWTIALNLCHNWFRTKSRRPATQQLSFDRMDSTNVEADVLETVGLDDWRRRLGKLSPAQRDAVVLRHVVGLSYREIAAATGRPVGTGKADVSRGLAALRRILEEEESK